MIQDNKFSAEEAGENSLTAVKRRIDDGDNEESKSATPVVKNSIVTIEENRPNIEETNANNSISIESKKSVGGK